MRNKLPVLRLTAAVALIAGAGLQAKDEKPRAALKQLTSEARVAIMQRAQVWKPTSIPEMDIRLGPQEEGAFQPNESVECEHVVAKLDGASPKFDCRLDDGGVVKVKFGGGGEVEGEVIATRLLWALGFGADRMYPVRVTCHGCPNDPWANRHRVEETHSFDPAAIERKAPGKAIETKTKKGWAWTELDYADPQRGGAPRSHRDALKLLAVFMQHSDSKPEQQRLVCLSKHQTKDGECDEPFLMLNDVGQTFGKANALNRDTVSSVNFDGWSKTRVWKDGDECVGRLSRSYTGTLENPKISEAGRAFLAGLLVQLTDRQIHDLFEVARVELRSRKPGSREPPASADEWAAAFIHKRDEIVNRRCGA
jgi:hypothetical protein